MARQKKQKQEDGGPGFLTTYADIVTLLMAFFVLLFAISSIDQVKFLSLLKGLEEDFGNTAYDDLIIDGGSGIVGAANQPSGSPIPVPGGTLTAQPLEAVHELAVLASHVDATEEDPTPNGREDDGQNVGKYLDQEQLLEVASRLQQVAIERSITGAMQLGFNERGLVIVLSTDDVLFASGSAELRTDISDPILGPIAEELAAFDNDIYIEGHTDDVPLDRDGYSNWDLSADRALAVLDYFELGKGIAPQRMVASGFGEYRPISQGASPQARQQNRRVELVIGFEATPAGPLQPIDDIPSTGIPSTGQPPGLAFEDGSTLPLPVPVNQIS